MTAPAETDTPTPPTALRAVALACGSVGVMLALAAPNLAAWHEHIETKPGVLTMFDDKVAASATFNALFWIYTLLGAAAVACALAAYIRASLGRSGTVALVLGIVAVAWKYVIYAVLIAVVLVLIAGGLGS